MRRPAGIAIAALTHILALSVGWAIYQAGGPRHEANPEAMAANGRRLAS